MVNGDAKFEELVVASQEIAAGTAQLVIASKVKADRDSAALGKLSTASKGVTEATGNVVATSKSCADLIEDSGWYFVCLGFPGHDLNFLSATSQHKESYAWLLII